LHDFAGYLDNNDKRAYYSMLTICLLWTRIISIAWNTHKDILFYERMSCFITCNLPIFPLPDGVADGFGDSAFFGCGSAGFSDGRSATSFGAAGSLVAALLGLGSGAASLPNNAESGSNAGVLF